MEEEQQTQRTILDHVENISVMGDVFSPPANEYWALVCLRDGLEFLCRQVEQCEKVVHDRVNPDGKLRVLFEGNAPKLKGVPQGLLTCAFHWYAISACQYVRTVGAIAYRQDSSRRLSPSTSQM